jgi:integral membrane protein
MPLEPKPAEFPRIRGALKFYMVASVITGVMLLLLCTEMLLKYVWHLELFAFGPNRILSFEPVAETPEGLESTGTGVNLSTGILIAHGWFYVVYLFSNFRLWSLMRWPFWKLLLLASGGIVPFLSFFLEARIGREVRDYLARREADAATAARRATAPSESDAGSGTDSEPVEAAP